MSEVINVITDPGEFLQFIADNNTVTSASRLDMINAIALANVGKIAGEVRKLARAANQEIFADDLLPSIPNSVYKVLAVVKGAATKIDVLLKFGNTTIVLTAINGDAFALNVGREFNFSVSRGMKINFRPQLATTIEMLRVIEFRIGQ